MEFLYEKEKTNAIVFPLGGIGSGSIGLSGNGRLADWEIFNHPGKGLSNGFTHIAVKAEAGGEVLDARALLGDAQPPFMGIYSPKHFGSYGFGPDRELLLGMPHFREYSFGAQFPFATINFGGERFPGKPVLHAFNPFIPLNDFDSSLPVAMFEIEFENNQAYEIKYSACFSLNNPLPKGRTVNNFIAQDGINSLRMSGAGQNPSDPDFGDMTIATDCAEVSYQEYWYRGAWFDNLGVFWRDFNSPGPLKNRRYDKIGESDTENPYHNSDIGSLCASVTVPSGEKARIRFVLSWNFPNYTNTWNPEKPDNGCCGGDCDCSNDSGTWVNYYATQFEDSAASMRYAFKNWERLDAESRLFSDALHRTSLPKEALDAITGNLATLKSPTCLRLTDGSFYGFEGCHCDEGCCEGSCSHVWNYAYALPYLFPALERSMRELEYKYSAGPIGDMSFRLQLPVGRARSSFRPCADGQFGGVIKTYREWKLCGDTEWLRGLWPTVKASIEYAWHPENPDKWDPEKRGVLTGRQHHTLDMELFGPNSWLTGFYLCALKAGAEMADALGDDSAGEYRELFKKGKEYLDSQLFNGEYYMQKIDVGDKSLLEPFKDDKGLYRSYWSEEHKELKYQIVNGCAVDQVLAQWHSNLVGLGEIFDGEKTRSALRSIYKHNYKKNMRDFFNPCRIFALQDEGGVVICEWPDLHDKPHVPVPYSEECMNGFEYQAAIHMIQEGFIDEGMEIVAAIRRRYDGERRNPWNEFECGSNYARSMASYALLPTFSGFSADMTRGMIGFNPIMPDYNGFWSVYSGWGEFEQGGGSVSLKVLYGEVRLCEIALPALCDTAASASVDGSNTGGHWELDRLVFDNEIVIHAGETLVVR